MTAHPGNLGGKPPLGLKEPKPVNGTAAGRRHMGKVKQLPCVCCGKPGPSDAHHCKAGGMARDDFKTIPLCKNHHQGPEGFHTERETWERLYGQDADYLPMVKDQLEGQWNNPWKGKQ